MKSIALGEKGRKGIFKRGQKYHKGTPKGNKDTPRGDNDTPRKKIIFPEFSYWRTKVQFKTW